MFYIASIALLAFFGQASAWIKAEQRACATAPSDFHFYGTVKVQGPVVNTSCLAYLEAKLDTTSLTLDGNTWCLGKIHIHGPIRIYQNGVWQFGGLGGSDALLSADTGDFSAGEHSGKIHTFGSYSVSGAEFIDVHLFGLINLDAANHPEGFYHTVTLQGIDTPIPKITC